jgi:hypothetical protein
MRFGGSIKRERAVEISHTESKVVLLYISIPPISRVDREAA